MMMFVFSILLLFLIGMTFYSLAKDQDKTNTWLWAIVGIIAYFGSGFVFNIFFGFFGFLIMDLMSANADINTEPNPLFFQRLGDLIGLVGGIIGAFILYRYLKYRWAKSAVDNEDVLDEEF